MTGQKPVAALASEATWTLENYILKITDKILLQVTNRVVTLSGF